MLQLGISFASIKHANYRHKIKCIAVVLETTLYINTSIYMLHVLTTHRNHFNEYLNKNTVSIINRASI
jgi:hypothetical protein